MDIGIRKRRPIYLPQEIIESFLSRLPVKALLRFKSVCKQWDATISHPNFTETHLRRSKHSPPPPPPTFLHEDLLNFLHTAQLVGFEKVPPIELDTIRFLCHCDGLYLISYLDRDYALWNPSRRSYKKLNLNQLPFDSDLGDLMCGICYDLSLKDYKVVFGDAKRYAVFYCRKNSWSDLREMNLNLLPCDGRDKSGVSFNGSIYWVRFSSEEGRLEIVYFDARDEKFKNLSKLAAGARLISSGDDLYLVHSHDTLFMHKVGDKWMELNKEEVNGVCCTHQNQILLHCCYTAMSVGYKGIQLDDSYLLGKRAKARSGDSYIKLLNCVHLFPYVENLFWD